MPSIDGHGRTEREARLRRWCSYAGQMDLIPALAKSMEGNVSDPMETIWLSASTAAEEMARWRCLQNDPQAAMNGINAARRVVEKYAKRMEFSVEWPRLEMPDGRATKEQAA